MKLSADEFSQIRKFILETSGLALTSDKEYLVRTRLEPVVKRHQLSSFADVVRKLHYAVLLLLFYHCMCFRNVIKSLLCVQQDF